MGDRRILSKKTWDFILASFVLGAFIVFGSVFVYNNLVFLGDLLSNPNQLLLQGPYDWADTAVFTDLIRSGYWAAPYPQFISGSYVWGLFPPLFMLIAIPIDAVIHNLNFTFLLLATLMQIPVLYYATRDWKHPLQKLFILLILGWSAITWHQFPLMMRLREQLAVMFMVLMFKNVFKLPPVLNHFVFSALMILSQPMVAVVGAVAYPIVEAGGKAGRFDKRYLLGLALLAMVFFGVYQQHFALKQQGLTPPNTIGFAHLAVDIAAPHYLPFLLMQLLPISVFYLIFCRPPFRWIWAVYVIGLGALFALTYFPSLFMQIIGPFSEDFTPMFYVMFVLGALNQSDSKLTAGQERLAGALVLSYLIAFSLAQPSLASTRYSDAFGQIPTGSKVLSVSVYFWEQPRWVLFKAFDFRLMCEFYLRQMPIKTYYSPMQQFYDTESVWPDTQKLIQAADAGDWNACGQARRRLADKADYLSLLAVTFSEKPASWSYGLWSRLNNQTMMRKCGISLEQAQSADPMQNWLVRYRLNAERVE